MGSAGRFTLRQLVAALSMQSVTYATTSIYLRRLALGMACAQVKYRVPHLPGLGKGPHLAKP
jgi:hypothetical protein